MRWPQIRKIVILKGHLLLFYTTTMNHFLIRLWGMMKSGFYTISSVVGPRRSSKALPKAKLAPRKGHGHCLVVCFQFDPLQLSKSQQNHYIWEVCLANWWAEQRTATPAASIGQLEGPMFLCHNAQQHVTQTMLQKLNELGQMKFCLINRIHLTSRQPTTTSSSISTTFCRENATSRMQKMLSKSSLNPEAQIFMLQE